MITFAGQSLFSSGPARVHLALAGRLYVPPFVGINSGSSYTLDADKAEQQWVQTGRLVSATEAGLWTLSDAIQNIAEATTTGALVINNTKTVLGLTILRYLPAETVDRGRRFSMAYQIEYRDIGP